MTRPRSSPPVKCGTSPLIAPSSVDLPAPVLADDEAQLAGRDREVDVAQHGRGRIGVGDRDVLEADHAATSSGVERRRRRRDRDRARAAAGA